MYRNLFLKKCILIYLIFALIFSSIGCYDYSNNSDDEIIIPKVEFNPDSGPGISCSLQPGDPNMDKNWDWTIDKWYNMNKSINQIQLPYFSTGSGTDAAMACKDYLPEDGWVLLCRNFGDQEQLTSPFYMLYNKPKGIIRLFFIYTGGTATYAVIKLTSLDGVKTSLFTFGQDVYSYNDNYDQLKDSLNNPTWNGLQTITEVIPNKWSVADFVVSFDPSIKDNTELSFNIWTVDETKLTINGRSTVEQITHQEKANFGIMDYAKAAFAILSTGKDAYEKINKKEKTQSVSSNDNNTSSDHDVISKSLPIGAACAIVAAAVKIGGIIKGVIDAKNAKTTVVDAEWTEYNLNGELTLNKLYDNFRMRLPGSKRIYPGSYEPLYDNPLGVFSLNTVPKVGVKKVNAHYEYYQDAFHNIRKFELYQNTIGICEPLQISVTNISGYKIESTQASIIWNDTSLNTKFNSEQGDKNYLTTLELYSTKSIFSANPINVNDTIGGVFGKYFCDENVHINSLYEIPEFNFKTNPELISLKIGVVVTLIPDGTDPKIPVGSDKIQILRTFTPAIIKDPKLKSIYELKIIYSKKGSKSEIQSGYLVNRYQTDSGIPNYFTQVVTEDNMIYNFQTRTTNWGREGFYVSNETIESVYPSLDTTISDSDLIRGWSKVSGRCKNVPLVWLFVKWNGGSAVVDPLKIPELVRAENLILIPRSTLPIKPFTPLPK